MRVGHAGGRHPTSRLRAVVVWPATRSLGASPAAPLGGIRQHEQVQTGEQEEGEREHRQEAHPGGVLPLDHGDDVDDDGHRKGHGQPAVGPAEPIGSSSMLTSSEDEPEADRAHYKYYVTDSRPLSRLRRPVGRFNGELLCVLGVEPRPTELRRLTTNDAADGSSAEKVIQNIETNVPPGSTH
jgi:hypothetical protein